MIRLHPSGQQIELVDEDQRVVVVEVGGGLRSYSVGDWEVLDGYGAFEMCSAGRGQALIPWPNRIDHGAYAFDGEAHQLPLSEPSTQTAIHGLTRFAAWTVAERGPAHAVMRHRLHPQPGYPFTLDLALSYRLSGEGLAVTCNVVNRGDRACPYGSGGHPYVQIGPGLIDSLVLRSPATEVLESDDRGLPISRRPVGGTQVDFRVASPIGSVRLDTAFTGLERDERGRATVWLGETSGTRQVEVWLGEGYRYLMLFSGDSLKDRPRQGLAIEPMTCAPNAFRSGDGLIRLEPGESVSSTWGIRPTP